MCREQEPNGRRRSQSPRSRRIEAERAVQRLQGIVDGAGVLVRLLVSVPGSPLEVYCIFLFHFVQRRHGPTPERRGITESGHLCGVRVRNTADRIAGSRDTGRDVSGGGGDAVSNLQES